MKTGILTYHGTRNIGAALQAHALQKVLTDFGHDCELIDYRSQHLEEAYKIKNIFELKSFKELVKWSLSVKSSKKSVENYKKFNDKYQRMSEETYTLNNIAMSNDKYNTFIVGSDQVWNMNLNGNDSTYLLDFVDERNRKISYAASFGYKEIPDKFKSITKDKLKSFDKISVREVSGQDIVFKDVNRESQVVLDPTLLLEKEYWSTFVNTRKNEKEYILMYIIAATPTILKFAKKLSKKYDCDIICVHNSFKLYPGVRNIRDCSPSQFLEYAKNAKFIVSSSFHGICFSILFEKQFFFELDNKPENNNSRIETLISKLNLWDREIIDGKSVNGARIKYSEVTNLLIQERKASKDFLSEINESSLKRS